jgi:hypothetical protein
VYHLLLIRLTKDSEAFSGHNVLPLAQRHIRLGLGLGYSQRPRLWRFDLESRTHIRRLDLTWWFWWKLKLLAQLCAMELLVEFRVATDGG